MRNSPTSGTHPNCLVCGENADSIHFGASSCRACAAFFRRKVASQQLLKKTCSGNCVMNDQVLRRFCAHCRFEKCLKVGMNPLFVISRAPLHPPTTSKSSIIVLSRLKKTYEKLNEIRKTTFWREDGSTPKLCNYMELKEEHLIDKQLIIAHFIPFFHKSAPMESAQKAILDAHFAVPFVLLERAFESQNGEKFLLPSGDFIDINNLYEFYQNPNELDDENARNAKILLEPYWKLNNQVLRQHLREVQLDLDEFLMLTALLYWDFGIPDQSDESIEICKSMRSVVLQELTDYERETRRNGEDALRIGEIMMVLQTVQKSLNIMYECQEISLVYQLHGRECPLFEKY